MFPKSAHSLRLHRELASEATLSRLIGMAESGEVCCESSDVGGSEGGVEIEWGKREAFGVLASEAAELPLTPSALTLSLKLLATLDDRSSPA